MQGGDCIAAPSGASTLALTPGCRCVTFRALTQAAFLPRSDPPLARNSKPADFEQALAELESLVERLEKGDLPLEEALRTFERGVALTRHCQASLSAAQQKVEILLKRSGQSDVSPFEEESADDTPTEPPADE
jgi:exodeoxyribonuclease VII small subunit